MFPSELRGGEEETPTAATNRACRLPVFLLTFTEHLPSEELVWCLRNSRRRLRLLICVEKHIAAILERKRAVSVIRAEGRWWNRKLV